MIGGERAAADAACVFVVELFDGRRFEAHGVGSAQVEVAGLVERGYFGAEVQSGFFVLRAAHAGGQYKAVRGSPFFLRVGGERIDGSEVARYVVGRFQAVVLVLYTGIEDVPVAEVEDAFHLRQHLLLYALLDALAGVVGDAVAVFEVVGDVFQLIVVEVTVAAV